MRQPAKLWPAFITATALCMPLGAQTHSGPWPTQQWATATPEEQGMDSRGLAALVDFGAANEMDSLVVTRHGRLVAEAYYAPFKPGMRHRLNSATKGVVATLTGIAIQQGKLAGTERPVLEFFADRTVAHVDDRKKAMTLQHLLDMTSGLDWKEPLTDQRPDSLFEMLRSPNWVQFVLDRPMAQAPGAAFNYSSGNSQLLTAILARQTGMAVPDFAAQQLFRPLGISGEQWRKDPQGVATGGFGLYLQTRDMAKLGYLYLHGGEWEGKQIVPRSWVDRVYQAMVPMMLSATTDLRYGDQWWTLPARKAYMAVGYHRQIILVLPQSGVVLALTGRKNYPLDQMLDLVDAAVKSDKALAPNPDGVALLAQRAKEVASEKPQAAAAPPLAQAISGKTYRLAPNNLGVRDFTLHLGGSPSYEIVSFVARGSSDTKKVSLPLGLNGQFAPAGATDGAVFVSKASWTDLDTLSVLVRQPEEAETVRYVLKFTGNKVALTHVNAFGFQQNLTGETSD
ncbi:MAG: serine hydrolase [Polaromonas sp.]|uniref:serine hydrolase domain-containing protein n=1 Tax=Polaromonas sp. TaxID=1869339 RepID=UPI002489D522|nr:serine hydrolase [Polaromonas sp.]MDI1239261.1 serine hydrolase [Polaromonas sp.]